MKRIITLVVALLLAGTAVFAFTAATEPEPVATPSPSATLGPAVTPVATQEATEPIADPVPDLVIDSPVPMARPEGVLVPPDFENVFEVIDPGDGYSGTPETLRLFLAHATAPASPRGESAGNAWLPLAVGDIVEVDGERFLVAERWEAPKPDYPTQPPLAEATYEQYTGSIVLVTCVPHADGTSATENLWVVLRPAL